jgi:hypothetical protein
VEDLTEIVARLAAAARELAELVELSDPEHWSERPDRPL